MMGKVACCHTFLNNHEQSKSCFSTLAFRGEGFEIIFDKTKCILKNANVLQDVCMAVEPLIIIVYYFFQHSNELNNGEQISYNVIFKAYNIFLIHKFIKWLIYKKYF